MRSMSRLRKLTLEQHAAIADENIANLFDEYRPRYNDVMGEKIAEVSRPYLIWQTRKSAW